LAATKCVTQVANLHAITQKRRSRHRDAVARLEPVQDFDLTVPGSA
jgi:hypothetical protein